MDTDDQLMARYMNGDERAFELLYKRYYPVLLRDMRRRVRRTDDAEDLVQTTFLHLHRARDSFRSTEQVRPWVFTIAHNVRRDYFRRSMRRPENVLHEELPGNADTVRPIETKQSVTILRSALRSLSKPLAQAVEMHWLEEMDFAEVAEACGVALGAARVRAHRGCAKLRVLMTRHETESQPLHAA